ncbi:cell division protein FtsQ/DivIB [Nocardioides panaciterrulae]|uniref:Cell division protein FtsQ n=1 Tax=Nocardioides panaciterrulae TaxID=661492 RepID=A0A7Y9E5U4_9ACTN|nr:cell division protein FtsQ [Nocardioides panaciterrulae]
MTDTEQSLRRTRSRFARRQWARRWLRWKAVLAVLLLLGLVLAGVWAVYFSSFLAVSGVEVTGADTVGAARIRAAAAVPTGEPLAKVDLAQIRSRVQALAAVRSADVSRQWPDQVLIKVRERTAVAVVEIGGQLRGMDADGVVFRSYRHAPPQLPHIQTSAGTRAEALAEGAKVVAALPSDLAAKVDHVEVETVDQITLVLRDGRVVKWGSAEQSDLKAEVVAALLHQPGQEYDVTVPGQPTVR